MVIDAHNHLGGPDKGDGRSQDTSEILAAMDKAGVEMAVVFPFNEAEPGISFSRTNDYIAASVKSHPDRLIGFCRLDPNCGPAALHELERCINVLGLRGVKLHPTSQGFSLTDPTLARILGLAESFGIPAVFDTGKKESPPLGVATLAREFPGLTIIMAHMNLYDESLDAARTAPNIYIGTTGYFNPPRLAKAVGELGAGRFIMGSDSPYIRMEREVEKINRLEGVGADEKKLIQGGNAARILGIRL